MRGRSALYALSALVAALAAGCAAPPPATPPAAAPAPAAAPVPARPAPVEAAPARGPSAVSLVETILTRVGGDSDVQISRTPTGALLLRATGDASFATASSTLSPQFRGFLQQLANALLTYPALATKVVGHTDSTGDDALNVRLSEARAQATINHLVSLGVPQSRLLSEGKGSSEPIASNDTPEGRASNRRVDLLIIEAGG